jgi:signal transduction histidine kinase
VTYLLVKYSLDGQAGVGVTAGTTDGAVEEWQAQQFADQVQNQLTANLLHSLLTMGGIALALVGATAIGFGYLLAGRILRPIQRITETAQRVSGGSLANALGSPKRIQLDGPHDELKKLADTFDSMLERLARAFDSQRRFVANASHELRTPLAINRTLVEVALRRREATDDARRLGEALLVVNARHQRLIDGLLTLANGENTVVRRTPVDLHDVAVHVIAVSGQEAAEAGIDVQADLAAAPTAGDAVLVERLVQNLLENAIRHNHAAGWLSVATRRATTGEAELVVANTGPAVPPYEVATLFEPFRRLEVDRVGSDHSAGLGLSIVRAVATSHGGRVSAQPRDGGGLIVTVRLPAAAPP